MSAENVLTKLGFSANEARVYLAALSTGLASAAQIGKKAGLQRTTTYSVLDYLVKRGVVGQSKVRGKTRFAAEPPEKLLTLVGDIQTGLKKALPELEALYNKKGAKPKILFFEGREAIQNVYDDTLREKPKEILEWNTDAYFERFPKDHAYIAKRMELGIRARRLAGTGSVWQTKHQPYDRSELSETLIVPRDLFWPIVEVNIYNDKVAFMNYADEMSVIIENKAIADAMRQAYELSWRGAKTLEVKPR